MTLIGYTMMSEQTGQNIDAWVDEAQASRSRGVPWAAPASCALAGPRSTYATPTAMTAPATGPIRYTHQVDRLPQGDVGPEASGRVHRGALKRPAHGPPGQDVGAHRQRHERPVQLRPVGQVQDH